MYATYKNLQNRLKERAFYSPLPAGGGGGSWSTDVGLLSENQHKVNLVAGEDLLLNEGDVPLLLNHFLHHLIERIDPLSTVVIGQGWFSLKGVLETFLHYYYESKNGENQSLLIDDPV